MEQDAEEGINKTIYVFSDQLLPPPLPDLSTTISSGQIDMLEGGVTSPQLGGLNYHMHAYGYVCAVQIGVTWVLDAHNC